MFLCGSTQNLSEYQKDTGDTSSHKNDIMQYAQEDGTYLSQQIDLISPNVVVCDTVTIEAYKKIYPNDKITQVGEWDYYHNDRLVILREARKLYSTSCEIDSFVVIRILKNVNLVGFHDFCICSIFDV